ncbi:MAG: hypothetical protein LBK66_06145 [Spirochaetaceae bacterium]|nr:hypothetical protein [Spirochaetaceae bacterium]
MNNWESCRPRMPTVLFRLKARSEGLLWVCRRGAACKPAGGAVSRVCKPLFADPKAEAEVCFGYANAERMETRWRARMPAALFRLKARSEVMLWACQRGAHVNPLAGADNAG